MLESSASAGQSHAVERCVRSDCETIVEPRRSQLQRLRISSPGSEEDGQRQHWNQDSQLDDHDRHSAHEHPTLIVATGDGHEDVEVGLVDARVNGQSAMMPIGGDVSLASQSRSTWLAYATAQATAKRPRGSPRGGPREHKPRAPRSPPPRGCASVRCGMPNSRSSQRPAGPQPKSASQQAGGPFPQSASHLSTEGAPATSQPAGDARDGVAVSRPSRWPSARSRSSSARARSCASARKTPCTVIPPSRPGPSASITPSASAACRAAASSRSSARNRRARRRCAAGHRRGAEARRHGGVRRRRARARRAVRQKLGVDLDNLLVSQPDNGEQALEIVEVLVRSGGVDVVVVDSVAALVPRAEIEGEMGEAQMGLQARLMSQALRKLTGVVSKSKTCLIFINQLARRSASCSATPKRRPAAAR